MRIESQAAARVRVRSASATARAVVVEAADFRARAIAALEGGCGRRAEVTAAAACHAVAIRGAMPESHAQLRSWRAASQRGALMATASFGLAHRHALRGVGCGGRAGESSLP